MNTHDVAHAFTALMREGKFLEAGETFWSDDVVSIEAMSMPGMDAVAAGKVALHEKAEWWDANNETHAFEADGPYINGDQFALRYTMDLTVKATGERSKGEEVALYTVKDGKIVEERFFYNM